MALDPQVRALLDQLEAAGSPEIFEVSPDEARRMFAAGSALMGGAGAQDVQAEDRVMGGEATEIRLRVYTPSSGQAPRPVVVFYHGGGFVIGDLDTHDASCRDLAAASGAVIVSVDYRLAPEHPFPAAVEDAYDALVWAHRHAAEIGGDPARLAVAGDSAGGNIGAVVAILARDRQGPPLRFQLLIYPATDMTMSHPSVQENGEGYFLTHKAMQWFMNNYLGDADPRDPLASPLFTPDLSGLPPAHIVTAGFDPLRDEGESYAERLREFGVAVTAKRYDDQVHGCFGMQGVVDASKRIIQESAEALRAGLA